MHYRHCSTAHPPIRSKLVRRAARFLPCSSMRRDTSGTSWRLARPRHTPFPPPTMSKPQFSSRAIELNDNHGRDTAATHVPFSWSELPTTSNRRECRLSRPPVQCLWAAHQQISTASTISATPPIHVAIQVVAFIFAPLERGESRPVLSHHAICIPNAVDCSPSGHRDIWTNSVWVLSEDVNPVQFFLITGRLLTVRERV